MAGDKHRRKSRLQEARIIASLAEKPKTVEQLAEEMHLCPSGVALYLKRMRTAHQVYVCDHEKRNGSPAKIWAAGNRPDAEYVPQSRPMPKTSAEERRAQVLELLAEKPRTIRELGPAMHLVSEAAGKYVRALRQPGNRQLHIAKWLHPREVDPTSTKGGDWAPVYAVGAKPDAPKPERETSRTRHARMQKDREYRRARNAARRLRYQQDKLIKKHTKAGPHSWLSALMVAA
jgi:hypothetical protein